MNSAVGPSFKVIFAEFRTCESREQCTGPIEKKCRHVKQCKRIAIQTQPKENIHFIAYNFVDAQKLLPWNNLLIQCTCLVLHIGSLATWLFFVCILFLGWDVCEYLFLFLFKESPPIIDLRCDWSPIYLTCFT